MAGQPGFFDLDERYRPLSAAGEPLERLAAVVDFEPFRPELETTLHVPRHATLSGYSDADLDALLWTFNTTPRKCLAFQTPLEAFAQHLGVALES